MNQSLQRELEQLFRSAINDAQVMSLDDKNNIGVDKTALATWCVSIAENYIKAAELRGAERAIEMICRGEVWEESEKHTIKEENR